MTICQIITACILATKMDKASGTLPSGAGKAILAFICLFVAGQLPHIPVSMYPFDLNLGGFYPCSLCFSSPAVLCLVVYTVYCFYMPQ